jgi:hypothetical protein
VWQLLKGRIVRLPSRLAWWGGTALAACVIAALQGGLLAELAEALMNGASRSVSYYEVTFHLNWPPTVISSHLGNLSLLNPYQLLVAFLEFGPLVLAAPLVGVWLIRILREGRWLEGSVILAGALSLFMPLVRYSGNAGPTATTRLYNMFIDVCLAYAVPLAWGLLTGRRRAVRILVVGAGIAATLSGVALFSIQLTAVPVPVASYFLTDLDVQMYRRQWDRLPAQAVVFDPLPRRAATVLGRVVDSQIDLAQVTGEYARLVEDPEPGRVHDAGFDFLYADRGYWEGHEEQLSAACVQLVDVVVDVDSATGEVADYRRLADLRACR